MQDELQRPRKRQEMPARVDYFVTQGDEQFGPMTFAQLQGYFRSGQITADSVYWAEGMNDWKPLAEISDRLGLKRKGESEVRESLRQRQREKRVHDRKASVRQTAFILTSLFLLIALIAVLFYFLGQII